MSELTEKSRKAQMEMLPEGPLRDATIDLYDKVEALNSDQRSLLLGLTVQAVQNGLRDILTEGSVTPRQRATIVLLDALVGSALYTSALDREAEGRTTLEDSKVSDVFDAVHNAVREAAGANISPEKRAKIEAAAAELQRRIQAGEDPDKVIAEVAKDAGVDFHVEREDGTPVGSSVPQAQAGPQGQVRTYEDEDKLHTGQYL